MKISKVLVSQICKVVAYPKLESSKYEYREESGILLWKRPAGFYEEKFVSSDILVTKEQIESNERLYIDGKKVFLKPHVEVHFINNSDSVAWFEDEEGMYDFLNHEYLRELKLITITNNF